MLLDERARYNLEDKVCIKQSQTGNVIVYCHGGGLEGSAETFRIWGARLALCTGCRVVLIDYRVAPENPFPAAINDVFSVCRALSYKLNGVGGTCDPRVANGLWHAWPLWGEFPEASTSLDAIAEHLQQLN